MTRIGPLVAVSKVNIHVAKSTRTRTPGGHYSFVQYSVQLWQPVDVGRARYDRLVAVLRCERRRRRISRRRRKRRRRKRRRGRRRRSWWRRLTPNSSIKRMQPQVLRNMQLVNQRQKFRSKQIAAETGKRWSS